MLRTRKKIPRVENTSIGKIFRLVLVEMLHQGLKKIVNDIALLEKSLQADTPYTELEKQFPEAQILR